MKCQFCQQPFKSENYGIHSKAECLPCNAIFWFKEDGTPIQYSFTIDEYLVIFDYVFPATDDGYKPNFTMLKDKRPILTFPFDPKLTPQNFRKRIHTILTFL